MSEYRTTIHNIDIVFSSIRSEVQKNGEMVLITRKGGIGDWGMSRLWKKWMTATAKHMAAMGCVVMIEGPGGKVFGKRPFNELDANEYFTVKYLGTDQDGKRLSWSKTGHDGMRPATKSERYHAMQMHEVWASERGIRLDMPSDSEYRNMEKAENQ